MFLTDRTSDVDPLKVPMQAPSLRTFGVDSCRKHTDVGTPRQELLRPNLMTFTPDTSG